LPAHQTSALYNAFLARTRAHTPIHTLHPVISVSKFKLCLSKQGPGARDPVLQLMTSQEVADHLWDGDRSVARRAIVGAAAQLASPEVTLMI
jgi:hypothetical protein